MNSRCLPIFLVFALALFMGLVLTVGLLLRPADPDRPRPLRSRTIERQIEKPGSLHSGAVFPRATEDVGATSVRTYGFPIGDATVVVYVGGEGPRQAVRTTLRNAGDSRLHDVRIREPGRDWSSARAILDSIVKSRKPVGDRELALAIFDYVHDHIERDAYRSRWDCFDVWKAFNCYGMGHCEVHARTLAALWEMAGLASLQANVHLKPELGLFDHTLAEVFYDGGWRLFDSHGSNFFLGVDNRTILGWRELMDSPELVERSGPTGDLYRTYDHTRWVDPDAATWTFDKKIARTEPFQGAPAPTLDLRPGEWAAFEREGGVDYVDNIRGHGPPKAPHSRVVFHGRHPHETLGWENLDLSDGFKEVGNGGLELTRGSAGVVRREFRSPFPIVSSTATLKASVEGTGSTARVQILPIGHPRREAQTLETYAGEGDWDLRLDLRAEWGEWNHPFVRYGYEVIVEATAPVSGSWRLESLSLETVCQTSTAALPNLSCDEWIVSVSPESQGELEIAIESFPDPEDLLPPTGLKASRIDSGTETWVRLEWMVSDSSLGRDWEVDISDDPDFRWTLLPFLTYRKDPRDSVLLAPLSLFPPRTRFYLRVRQAAADGLKSEWSETLEFIPRLLR